MGKSSLALNIATNVAKDGKIAAFFSLEMTKEELVQRVLFSEAKVTSGDARNCLLYTSPSPRDATLSRMPSSA